jgi:Carboxypeptidase regulatory-like domain
MVASAIPAATTCVGMPPLKTLHRVWGVVFFASGDRIANANVSVLEGDKEIAVQETDDHGKFSFDQLNPGNYVLCIRVNGVPGIAGTRVVLASPNAKSKKEIAVNISITVANCSSFSLVDAKHFEARLKIRATLKRTYLSDFG